MPEIYLCFLSNLTKMTSKGLQKAYILKIKKMGVEITATKWATNLANQGKQTKAGNTVALKHRFRVQIPKKSWNWGELGLRGEEHQG